MPTAISDAELESYLASRQKGAEIESFLASRQSVAQAPPPRRGIVIGSLLRGIDNLQGSLYGAGALVADSADALDTREWLLNGYLRNTREAQENPAEVATWKEADSLAKKATYGIEAIMENLPTMVPAMVTGGGAALLAGAGRKALAAGVGAYAANWAQESGSIYGDISERTGLKEPGVAAGYGAAAAGFETAADLIGISRFIPAGERKAIAGALGAGLAGEIERRFVARGLKGAAKQAAVESATEAVQTALEEAAVTHADPTKPFWTSQTMDRVFEAARKAAFAGGAFGGVAGVVPVEADGRADTQRALDSANESLRKAQEAREQGAPETSDALEALTLESVADIAEPTEEGGMETAPLVPPPPTEVAPAPEIPTPAPESVFGRISQTPVAVPPPPVEEQADLQAELGQEAEPGAVAIPGEESLDVPALERVIARHLINSREVADADWTIDGIKQAMGAPQDQWDRFRIAPFIDAGIVEKTPEGHYRFNAEIVRQATTLPVTATPTQAEPKAVGSGIGSVYQGEFRGQPKWFLQVGEERGFGDEIYATPQEAQNAQQIFNRRREERAASVQRESDRQAAELAAKNAREDLGAFFEGMTPLQRGKVAKSLTTKLNYKGQELSRRDIIRRLVNEGRTLDGDKLIDQEGSFLDARRLTKTGIDYARFLIGERAAAAETPQAPPPADPIDAALTKAIEATDPTGKSFDFVAGVSYAAANAILRVARAVYRTGRSIAESIAEAIRQHRADNPTAEFDDAELSGKLNDVLQLEAAEPPPPTTPQPQVDPTNPDDNPPAVSQAIRWINDPEFTYRKTTNDGRIEAMNRFVDAFAGDLRAAIQFLAFPKPMSGITPDLQEIGLMVVADRAGRMMLEATGIVAKHEAWTIVRDAVRPLKGAASITGQALQAMTIARKILGGGVYMAEYERFIQEQQQRKISDAAAQEVAGVVNGSANTPPSEEAQQSLLKQLNKFRKGVSWKQVFSQARESQIDYARAIFRLLTEAGAGGNRDNRVRIANELSANYWATIRAARQANIVKELATLTAVSAETKRAIAGAVPELIRLANTGVLDYQAARNAIAGRLKLPQFSQETARRLYEGAQEAQRKPPGSQRDTAIRKVLNIIPEETGVPLKDVIKAAWYGGILSGLATQSRNFLGSVANLATEYATLSVRSPKDAPRMLFALFRGLRESALTEFPAVIRGAEPGRLNVDVRDASNASELLVSDTARWKRLLSNYRYVSRFMQAVDSLWYDAAHEVQAVFDAAARARSEPTTGDIDARIDELLKLRVGDRERARAQAESEAASGLTDKRQIDRRTLEIIRQLRPSDIQENAARTALYSTFNQEPEGLLGMMYQGAVRLRQKYPIFVPLIPFVRISANVTNAILNASPAGLVRMIAARPDSVSIPLIGDRLRYAERRLTVSEYQQLRARVALSTGVFIGLGTLMAAYMDDDDPEFQITGSMRGIPRAKVRQLETQGIKPYQIRIGGVGFDYRITPGALMFAALGNWGDATRYGKDDPEALTQLEAVLSAGHAVIMDQSFLSGISGLISDPVAGQQSGFVDRVMNFGARSLGGFIPQVTKEMDSWANPTVQQAKGFREQLQRQIPVARWALGKPMLNALGEEIERPRYPWSWAVSGETEDPVWSALAEKAAAGVFLPVVSRAARIDRKPMTDEQFAKYQRIAGQLTRKRLESDLTRFRAMTPEQAKEYFERALPPLREQARARIR